MGGCLVFNFSLVGYRMHRLRAFYRSKGLVSRIMYLENGTTMRCWVQIRDGPQRRRWRRKITKTPNPNIKPLHERPALLLLHGFGGDGTVAWEHQIAHFSKDYRLYVPDLIFWGGSTTSNSQRSEIFQADCIHNMLVNKLGVQEAHVVGTSYGGFVAFWLASKYPEMVKKLVLSSTGICMDPSSNRPLLESCGMSRIEELLLPTTVDGLKLTFSLLYERSMPLPDFILQQILDLMDRVAERLHFKPSNHQRTRGLGRVFEMFYPASTRQSRIQLLDGLSIGSDKCPPLPVLKQEALIIWGREDKIFNLDLAYRLRRHLGSENAQFAIMEGVGHVPQVERYKDFNSIVYNFLDDSVADDDDI